MTPSDRRALTAVARGQAHADLYVRGATLLSVYTGELYLANVAVRGEQDFLPSVRLTPRGVWDVKGARVLLPSRRR